jgi:hypothetical protein
MTESRGPRGGSRRPSSSSATRAMGSAGMPASDDDVRMAELEARLERLESKPGVEMEAMRTRGRALMRRVMPSEANRHFRNAAREQLLGFRAIVDFWIARVDEWDVSAPGAEDDRTSIEIE